MDVQVRRNLRSSESKGQKRGTLTERTYRRTDRQTDRMTGRQRDGEALIPAEYSRNKERDKEGDFLCGNGGNAK